MRGSGEGPSQSRAPGIFQGFHIIMDCTGMNSPKNNRDSAGVSAPNLEQQRAGLPVTFSPNPGLFPSSKFYYLIYGEVFIGSPEIEVAAVVAKKRTSTSSSFCSFSKFGRILSSMSS